MARVYVGNGHPKCGRWLRGVYTEQGERARHDNKRVSLRAPAGGEAPPLVGEVDGFANARHDSGREKDGTSGEPWV